MLRKTAVRYLTCTWKMARREQIVIGLKRLKIKKTKLNIKGIEG